MSCRTGFYLLSAAALTCLSGCDRGAAADPAAPGAAHVAGPYFDLRGLLDAQVRQLTAHRSGVIKQVSLRGGTPEKTQVPQVKWTNELQIFYQADINKAALRGAYRIDSAAEGNAVRRTYTLQPGHDKVPVVQLSVLSAGGRPQEIRATLRQDNVLFSGQKDLRLSLQQGKLRTYGVRGTQKLVLFDTLHYQTQTSVLFDTLRYQTQARLQ